MEKLIYWLAVLHDGLFSWFDALSLSDDFYFAIERYKDLKKLEHFKNFILYPRLSTINTFLFFIVCTILIIKLRDKEKLRKVTKKTECKISKNKKKEILKTRTFNLDIIYNLKCLYKDYWQENLSEVKMENKKNIDPDNILTDFQYKKWLKLMKKHSNYRRYFYLSICLCMSQSFWLPAILMMWLKADVSIAIAFGGICAAQLYTYGIWSTLSIAASVTIHPIIRQKLYFHGKYYPMNEGILEDLGYNNNAEANITAVLGGTFLGKFLK